MRAIFRQGIKGDDVFAQGYTVLEDALPNHLLKELSEFYNTLQINSGGQFLLSNLLNDLSLRRTIHSRLFEILGSRMSEILSEFKYVLGTFAVKPVGSSSAFGLHQDWSLVDERKAFSLSVWIPLADVSIENGCFRLLKGSCKIFDYARGMNIPFPYAEYAGSISEDFMTPVPMKRGDVLVFDHRLVHDSGPNLSDKVRVAAVMAFVPKETHLSHYYHPEGSDRIDFYELPDDFLIDNNFFAYDKPPAKGRLLTSARYNIPEIDFEMFKRLYASSVF